MSLALGGLLGLAFAAIYYAATHGSTQEAHDGTFWSWDGATWCRLQIIQPSLLLAGLVLAFARAGAGRLRRLGLGMAVAALAALALALILQCWVAHPDRDFESLPVFLGFLLGVVANVPLAAGLILLGLAARRSGAPAPNPLISVGALVLLTALIAGVLQDLLSTGGRVWEVALTLVHLPLALAWILLGRTVWKTADRLGRPGGPSKPAV